MSRPDNRQFKRLTYERPPVMYDKRAAIAGLGLIVLSVFAAAVGTTLDGKGHFLPLPQAPLPLRGHLFDATLIPSIAGGVRVRNGKSNVFAETGFATAFGMLWEFSQLIPGHGTFDTGDLATYAIAGSAYAAIAGVLSKKDK